jgi:hypothetical protein
MQHSNALTDPSVATVIGALALANLAAGAGMRYNLGGYRRISLSVDEVSNVLNQPLIEILNKGAEGGIFKACAMQTLADLAKRLGSEDAARMALGMPPNLQYFASVSGGRIIKGRFPTLDPDPPSSSAAPAATAQAIR